MTIRYKKYYGKNHYGTKHTADIGGLRGNGEATSGDREYPRGKTMTPLHMQVLFWVSIAQTILLLVIAFRI